MSANTKIEWAHHTFNGWWGCTKVSPGCANCYAETFSNRTGHHVWGANAPRRFFAEPHWKEPLKWDRLAKEAGKRERVFCGSMMDIGEDRPDLVEPRKRICDLVERTPNLDWLLLTKRPENHTRLMTWGEGRWPDNDWAMTTVENQKMAEVRIPELLKVNARVRGLSMEPMLEAVTLRRSWLGPNRAVCANGCHQNFVGVAFGRCGSCFAPLSAPAGGIHWAIVGGESGHHSRPFHLEWARSIIRDCKNGGAACFVKQLGAVPISLVGFNWADDSSRSYLHVTPSATNLVAPSGRKAATVWSNGTWHTWDRQGIGGENGVETSVAKAKEEAALAVLRQGFHPMKLNDPKGGDMSEWPEDLRVRELPEVSRG